MIVLLQIAGGVALLLLGVRYLRKGLDRLFGQRLGAWMRRVGSNPGLAFVSGILVSVVAPSSTTMSILAVQTVQSGYMNARQMLAVMLGANIGLTILVQLVALRLDAYGPAFIAVGYVLFQYAGPGRTRGVGQVLLSLGFFFLAMWVIRLTIQDAQITQNQDFRELMQIAEKYPLGLAAAALAMTTLLQSSTATIGLVIGMGAIDSVSMRIVIPVVVGANLGLGVTALIVGWRQVESRRLGMANLALKGVVAAACLALLSSTARAAAALPGPESMRIANLHTGFNVLTAIIGMPLLGFVSRLMERIWRAPADGGRVFGPKFIHSGTIDSFALASGQSLREILHMSEIVRSMLHDVWTALKTNDDRLARHVSQRDNQVDLLDGQIKRFLTRLMREDIEHADAAEQIRQLQYLTELETAGDIIDKNISELVLKKIRLRAQFTPEGERELDEFYQKIAENQMIADTVFSTRDRRLAEQLVRHKEFLTNFERELRDRHFARLNAGRTQSQDTSAIHLDLITHLKRINSCLSHVAYGVLQNEKHVKEVRDEAAGE